MVFLLALLLAADPHTLMGRVVNGDTLVVLDADNHQEKIRLAGIDAPESKQPFGTKAKQALSGMVFGKTVEVEYTTKDHYGRILGTIYLDGR